MSKIEKALNRARGVALVRAPAAAHEAGQRLVPVPSSGSAADIERRALSAQAIARMQEPVLRSRTELADSRVIFPEMTDSDTVKALRELRTKIIQKAEGRNCVVLVTSLVPRGGGSFIAFNLATAFAFDAGRTALLVDCNLREPSLPRLFAGTPHLGLTDYLEDPTLDLGNIIHPIGIERLRVIPAGGRREVPGEYFTSVKMRRLLDTVRSRYPERFVILDAPPMTEAADMQTLAELSDYLLLVVPYGKVTTSQIEEAVKNLPPGKVLGVVFNDQPGLPSLPWRQLVSQIFAWMRARFVARLRRKPAAG
jgi:capsular exopolysaccharide synthesis family protein